MPSLWHDVLLASANWYYDGPGWIVMIIVSLMIGPQFASKRWKFWAIFTIIFVVIMPLVLLLVRHC